MKVISIHICFLLLCLHSKMAEGEGHIVRGQNPGVANPAVQNAPAIPIPSISPPAPLSSVGDLGLNWSSFKQMWQNYSVITDLTQKPADFQCALFLHTIGEHGLKIYNGFQFRTDADSKNLDTIFAKFDQFTIGERNETYERYVFNNRIQHDNENIDTYVSELIVLAKTCNFGDLHDSLLRDRIVLGIRNNQTRKKLLQTRNLTLAACIDTCRAAEATDLQASAIDNVQSTPEANVSAIKRDRRDKKFKCSYCGTNHKKRQCPAYDSICDYCEKKGHWASECRSKQKAEKKQSHNRAESRNRNNRRNKSRERGARNERSNKPVVDAIEYETVLDSIGIQID